MDIHITTGFRDTIGGGVIVMVELIRWTCFAMVIGLAVIVSIMIASADDPLLFIDSPSDGEKVYSDTITVSGRARGTGGAVVESVTVNDVLATDTILWSAEVSLHAGSNTITVVATDDTDNSTTKTITVILDGELTPTSTPTTYVPRPSPAHTPSPTHTYTNANW